MPPKNSRSRRDRKAQPAIGQSRPAPAPTTDVPETSPSAISTPTSTAVRPAPRRRPRATANLRPGFGEPIFAWMHRVAVDSPSIGRLFGPESSLWTTILLFIPILFLMLYLSTGIRLDRRPDVDVDYWWHVTTGKWILDHHSIPRTDPFSWSYGGQTWIAHEWLAEVMLALADRIGGYAANIVLTTIICTIGFWRLIAAGRFYGMSRRTAVLVTLLFCGPMVRSGVMVVRPQVWTWALLAILVAELAAYDTGKRKYLWIIPPLFAVWVNMNLTALIGFGCLGAFVLDRLVRRPWDRHVITVGIASGLAILVNPHHVKLLFLIFKYLNPDSERRKYIFEWMAPRTSNDYHIPFWIGLVFVVPALYYLIRKVPHFWPAAPLLVLAYQSYQSIRYIPLYLMLVIVFIGWLIWQRSRSQGIQLEMADTPLFPHRPWIVIPPIVAAVLAVVLVTSTDRTQFLHTPNPTYHPANATTFLLENYPDLKMFNTYDFGGYLIYRFYGTDHKVYIDGREEMFGEERVHQYFSLIYGQPGWQDYFDENGIQLVMIRRIDGLSSQIAEEPSWSKVYDGGRIQIYVRSDLVKS